jgi:O-antigen/teichoic acid export membrane protein
VNLRNIIWNMLGLGLPLLMAVVAVPILLANIGTERFGLLGLAWGLVGYASVLDFGMSRALTQKLAQNRNTPQEFQARAIVKSAVLLTAAISVLFMCGMLLVMSLGIENLFVVESVSSRELSLSALILAFTLPVQAISMAYRGINEAYLNFRGISVVRILLGAANFGLPCAMSYFTTEMHILVVTILIARICALAAFFALSRHCLPTASSNNVPGAASAHVKSLLHFGGWVAVSSVLLPLLMMSDRFFIGALVNTHAVTSYIIPYEILVQGLIIVGAVTTIAFPSISQLSKTDPDRAFALFVRWTGRITAIMIVIQAILFVLLPSILMIWVGNSLDPSSVIVGRILAIGVCAYTVGTMCTSYLHAYGKTKEVAVLQIIETPLYLLSLGFLVLYFGEIGAALAWTVRVTVDSLLLATTVLRMKPSHRVQAVTEQ